MSFSKKKLAALTVLILIGIVTIIGFLQMEGEIGQQPYEEPSEDLLKTRENAIPDNAVKMTAETDSFPPVLHSSKWEDPIPLSDQINTAGAEDSPFINPDGNTLYFWFTPDVDVSPQKQMTDGLTGIWWSRKSGGAWTEPERITLSDDVSLDGCPYIRGNEMWFCSVRQGNYPPEGPDMWIAELSGGKASDWHNAGRKLNEEYRIGEMHLSAAGNKMFFHSNRKGGEGGYDIWKTEKTSEGWSNPVNLGPTVNSNNGEYQPFLTQDGEELWFTRQSRLGYTGPAIYRSEKIGDEWSEPEEIISNFSGEPTLDNKGNIYFVHLFYSKDIEKIEADIYTAYRK